MGSISRRDFFRTAIAVENMKVTNHQGMEQYIKEPVREGWGYGDELL